MSDTAVTAVAMTDSAVQPPSKKFKFMQKCGISNAARPMEPEMELANYLNDVTNGCTAENALGYWQMREATSPTLAPLALDLVAAPASEAYCERVFSVCGDLTAGKRNRTSASLEQRVSPYEQKTLVLNCINC